ncbi:MAG TPA: FecR domain-containing protein [Bryobacteraceae bacterium]|nr:FecR domain-containing protein [Bryobacteraceae bacterium]
MNSRNLVGVLLVGGLIAGSVRGQHVISARSGLVHYTEGQVFLGEAINPKPAEYPEMKEGQHLTTKAGRAEVLLTPGVFLRVAENSDIQLLSNKLTDTRVEIVSGSAILEASEVSKDSPIQMVVAGTVVEIRKAGVFRLEAGSPSLVRVYDGEAIVIAKSGPVTVKEGRQLLLASVPSVEKFAKDDTDSFMRWAGRRSGYLAAANMSSANYMRERSIGWSNSGWYYNSMLGMFTYIPFNGRYRNYWDYNYYSPREIQPPSVPLPAVSRNDGFGAMSTSSRGMQDMSGRSYSGAGMSSGGSGGYQAPATSSAPSSSSGGGSRGGDSGGGGSRGGSGGGR